MKRGLAGRWIAALLGMSCAAALLVDPSLAASPPDGKVGPLQLKVSWSGPARDLPGPPPGQRADVFILTVDVEPDFWITNKGGVDVTITWTDEMQDFDLQISERNPDGSSGDFAGGSAHHPPGNSETVFIPEASGDYNVRTVYDAVIDSGYTGLASFSWEPTGGQAQVVFEPGEGLQFAPASIVSAHFLGTEPMMTMERHVTGSDPKKVDPDRIFVDWPLAGRTQVGQLSRSEDGGDSFRLLFDPACVERSRPNCATGGGSDTVTDVNLIDGTLYFSDQEAVFGNQALASSTDHGDSFPVERQHVISNATTVTDRQWLASAGDAVRVDPTGTDIGAFLSYHVPLTGQYIQGIVRSKNADGQPLPLDGRPLPQPAPQIPLVVQSGPLRVDTSSGPGRGWLYQPYEAFDSADLRVATARGAEYQDPNAWQSRPVSPGFPLGFPWLELDARGNAYLLWVNEDGELLYSASAIDDDANNPTTGGRPGWIWTEPARVAPDTIGSVAFPEIVAGAEGRVAITYLACPRPCGGTDDYFGPSDEAPPNAEWHAYAAVITNALQQSGPARVTTGQVSHRPVHSSQICTNGLFCVGVFGLSSPGDRSLADMIDIGYDQDGRVAVVFTDNNSGFGNQVSGPSTPADKARPFAHFAKQVSGPSLLGDAPDVAVTVPSGEVTDDPGDATWPNVAEGVLLPSLDALALSVRAESDEIVARLDLAGAGFMARDFDVYNNARNKEGQEYPDAERLQYIVRVTTDSDIYHLSASTLVDGRGLEFFGGLLGSNDALRNPDGTILGAAYKADPGFRMTGSLEGDTLTLRAPLSELGLEVGNPVYSVTAFSTAGPRAEDESLMEPMRTIDATPPFDAILAPEPLQATLTYTGDTEGKVGGTAAVSARLATPNGSPLPGRTISFSRGGKEAVAVTANDGVANTTLHITGPPGSGLPVIVTFGGDPSFLPVSIEAPFTAHTGAPKTVRGAV